MKPSTLATQQTIQRDHAIYAKPRLLAEWDYNRFAVPQVTVNPAQSGDEWLAAFGDLQSVALPNRPHTGIAKMRLDAGVRPLGAYRDAPNASRFYPAGDKDPYKYFGSAQVTQLAPGADLAYNFDDPIQVAVVYDRPVVANKIVVGFETSYAKPVTWTVEYTLDGISWYPAVSNTAIASDGTAVVWRGRHGWDIVQTLDQPAIIKGVKINVYSMNQPYAHLDVLQIGARLENDLTDYLISYDSKMEVADRSFIAPLGKASSNTASIVLSNIDGRFNNHNPASIYHGMIDKKVKLTMDLGVDASPHGGQRYEYIREFTMWADAWTGEGATKVSVECKDSSVLLQERTIPVVFYEDTTAGAIVWQIMDYLGYSNYKYTRNAQDTGTVIPFYWPNDDQQTVWDAFSELSEATQTAIYFDEHDVMQIRPRRAMYGEKGVDWNLDAIANGVKLPDIQDMEVSYDLEVNQVNVVYRPAHYSDQKVSQETQLESLWEPVEDTVLLRGSALQKSLLTAGTELWIVQAEALLWPFQGTVNIEGEMLNYSGKEYAYYTPVKDADGNVTSHTLNKKVLYSAEEQTPLDALDEFWGYKNSYTGRFLITERGVYGTLADNHYTQVASYHSYIARGAHATFNYDWSAGGTHRLDGYVKLTNNETTQDAYHILKHPMVIDTSQKRMFFGTRIRFPNESVGFRAGLLFGGDSGRGGYMMELAPTAVVQAEDAALSNELALAVLPPTSTFYYRNDLDVPDPDDGAGYPAGIVYGNWYDLDVVWNRLENNDVDVTAYLNGVHSGRWTIPAAQVLSFNDRFGIFVRGNCEADFEYVYCVVEDQTNPFQDPDATSFLDLRRGGFASGFVQKEVTYNFGPLSPAYQWTNGGTYYPQRVLTNRFAFDEFAPVVHEVRKFNVQFKDGQRPVGHSNLYVSNPSVETLYYTADAFGAEFMLANASRTQAIVKGEDTVTTQSADSSINQDIFAYGACVYQEDERTTTTSDDTSVRRRGAIKTDFNNRLIQTADMATALGDWITELYSGGVDEVTLTIFGNPLLQLGDLVTINYPIKDMLPSTHKYFVVAINGSFATGYTTKVTLRRANV